MSFFETFPQPNSKASIGGIFLHGVNVLTDGFVPGVSKGLVANGALVGPLLSCILHQLVPFLEILKYVMTTFKKNVMEVFFLFEKYDNSPKRAQL